MPQRLAGIRSSSACILQVALQCTAHQDSSPPLALQTLPVAVLALGNIVNKE